VTEQRTKGFTDGIMQCNGGIKVVASQPADFLPDKGLQVMETMLQGQTDIKAVYTHDDDMAMGAVQAIATPIGRTRCSSPARVAPRTR
jgi:ribose transport system substrate-binding protein